MFAVNNNNDGDNNNNNNNFFHVKTIFNFKLYIHHTKKFKQIPENT